MYPDAHVVQVEPEVHDKQLVIQVEHVFDAVMKYSLLRQFKLHLTSVELKV